MAKVIEVFCVGRIKDSPYTDLTKDYCKRLTYPQLLITDTKNIPLQQEKKILECFQARVIPQTLILALMDKGKSMNSEVFSQWLGKQVSTYQKILFVIGAAYGIPQGILEQCQTQISLSSFTFPHELARLVLVEQIYRAETQRLGHPYHHGE